MISFSPLRLLMLIKFKRRVLAVASVGAAFFAFLFGLVTPYFFRSEAIIQVLPSRVPSAYEAMMGNETAELYNASVLLQSPLVLERVVTNLKEVDANFYALFPKALSLLNFRHRLQLIRKRIWDDHPALLFETVLSPIAKADNTIAMSALSRHVRVETDTTLRTLKVTCESATPFLAKLMCENVIQGFLEYTASREKKELQKQEQFFNTVIQKQMENVHRIEDQMREIVEKTPEMTPGADSFSRGAATIAKSVIEKKELLARLQQELEMNRTLLSQIQRDVATQKPNSEEISADVASKITDEINDLELKRLQYTKVSDYDENHPEILAIRQRVVRLRRTLAAMNRSGRGLSSEDDGSRNLKKMMESSTDLKEKNRKLKAEFDSLSKQLDEQKTALRKTLKTNFLFDSLSRELTANINIIVDLYRELQKTRISIRGLAPSTSVVSPASFSMLPASFSVAKRTLFGLFVGFALMTTILLLLDLLDPRALEESDLVALRVSSFGLFNRKKEELMRIVYCLLSLKLNSDETRDSPSGGQVITFFGRTVGLSSDDWVLRIAEKITERGHKVALIVVRDDTEEAPQPFVIPKGVDVKQVSAAEMPLTLPKVAVQLKAQAEFVLIVAPPRVLHPSEEFLGRVSDHFVYGVELGVSSLNIMKGLRDAVQKNEKLAHHGLVFTE